MSEVFWLYDITIYEARFSSIARSPSRFAEKRGFEQ